MFSLDHRRSIESTTVRQVLFASLALFALGPLRAADNADPGDTPDPTIVDQRWESAYIGSDRIGFFHVVTRKVAAQGKGVFHTRQHGRLTVQRFGQKMSMETLADYWELEDGRLYATAAQSQIAQEVSRSRGTLVGPGKFQVTIESKGTKVSETLDWPAMVLGPYAQDESLRKDRLTPGQTRSFRTFLPELNVVSNRTLRAKELGDTTLADGTKANLLQVIETSDAAPIESTLWLDEEGQTRRMSLPLAGFQMTTYRSTKEDALQATVAGNTDLGYQTLVKPDKPVPHAHSLASATYRLRFSDDQAASAITESPHQKILSRQGSTLDVRIQRARPENKPSPSPGDEFLGSNTYIQPDNPKIQAVAKEVTKGFEDPWEKATLLEAWVDQNMSNQDFSIGFASSNEIIDTRRGDCTEHAVLLAALCRAEGIPARVAMGLVYLEQSESFGYHMWTEVFVGGDWYSIDGTIGHGSIGAGHIKIADGSLKGVDANSTFLPIFKVIGKLQIDLLNTQ
ncbi:transglutaminase-like domain-containing protein [bacterium]|nr:transglutaminase-like domain-containing protein [bacterium]